jgi:hypothetical protein
MRQKSLGAEISGKDVSKAQDQPRLAALILAPDQARAGTIRTSGFFCSRSRLRS